MKGGPRRTAAYTRAQLDRFDSRQLTPTQRIEAATLRWSLQSDLDAAPYEDHTCDFNQFCGAHLWGILLFRQWHPMPPASDIDNRLARRRAAMPGLGATERQAATAQAVARVETQVRPAYQRLASWMDDLLPRCGSDAGLWRCADGEAAYAAEWAVHTTTAMGAREIHAIGLQEVARIEAEMDRVLRSLGRSQGSVSARFDALEAELQPPVGRAARGRILKFEEQPRSLRAPAGQPLSCDRAG